MCRKKIIFLLIWVFKNKFNFKNILVIFKNRFYVKKNLQIITRETYILTFIIKVFRLLIILVAYFDFDI